MESERLLVAAGLTAAAAVVGAFIFWGPSTSTHSGRGRLAGLANMGKTCFLNAILHALAACPQFIEWLEKDGSAKETSLRATLSTVLSVVNGVNKSVQDSYAPAAVINALKRLGWVIPAGEQDAHELLNVILTTLDEETQKMTRTAGCLSDALGINEISSPDRECDSPVSFNKGSVMSLNELSGSSMTLSWRASGIGRRYLWISQSCRSLHLSGPPPQISTHPFSGTLASQLQCTVCSYKSTVKYDKFECLSLPLPVGAGDVCYGRHRLQSLLANFTSPEEIQDVECEQCNRHRLPNHSPTLSKQVKMLNFGKLPICLCIHISRNTWNAHGISKRQDYVQFPVRLSLAAYTYIRTQYSRKPIGSMYQTSTSEGGSPLSNSMPAWWNSEIRRTHGLASEWQNMYQLAAVIVHTGDAYSGHFITYRRGYQNSKWYYTSDIEIREVTIDEVLQSTAYMLFYEKSTNISDL